jgi:hypothetical protein
MRQAVRAVVLACSLITAAASAHAQSTLVEPPSSPEFMTRFDFGSWRMPVRDDPLRWDTDR